MVAAWEALNEHRRQGVRVSVSESAFSVRVRPPSLRAELQYKEAAVEVYRRYVAAGVSLTARQRIIDEVERSVLEARADLAEAVARSREASMESPRGDRAVALARSMRRDWVDVARTRLRVREGLLSTLSSAPNRATLAELEGEVAEIRSEYEARR